MGEIGENTWVSQLALPGIEISIPKEVAGVEMALVKHYLVQWQALESQIDEIKAAQKDLRTEMEGDGLPVKSVLAALKIARARRKIHGDSSAEMFAALLLLSMAVTDNPSE